MYIFKVSTLFIVFLWLGACQNENKSPNDFDLQSQTWENITEKAEGAEVSFMMWQGDAEINDYINNYVIPSLKERHNIALNIIGGQGPEIVQLIMGEKQAGVPEGQADVVWINGETFFQLRMIDGLWGPFVQHLPNAKYIDFDNPFINTDFQQPVNYMEAPWGINQFAIIYNSEQVDSPPGNLEELESFIKANPGSFTISNDFTGMTLLKSFLVELSGSADGLDGPFDEDKYIQLSDQLWDYINANKKHFWKQGTTFPKEKSKMNQMYASGELKISYGFSEGGVEAKVREGLFPEGTIAYAWDTGTIRNANYLGIPYNSGNKAAAMTVINFLLSPEAQFKKADPKGMDSNPVLDISKLPENWQEQYNKAEKRKYGAQLSELADKAIQEPAPEYMIRLYEDFRKKVIEK